MKLALLIALFSTIATSVLASEIGLDMKVVGDALKPILEVQTDLPPKTLLMATVVNPINQGGDGYLGQVTSSVQADQHIQFGPFSKSGKNLTSGLYKVTVVTLGSSLQPTEVQSYFGKNGQNLSGGQVIALPALQERVLQQTYKVRINADGSMHNLVPDVQTIGSANDVWKKVKSDGREIYVKTNGTYYTKERYSGCGFHTYIVANLPASTIVGAPQSVMNDVEGNCETRTFRVLGSLFFEGKNRSGAVVKTMPADNIERRLVSNSPFEKAFDMLCKTAEQTM